MSCTARLGDKLVVLIDGELGSWIAEVIQEEPLRIRSSHVSYDLEPKDYTIMEEASEKLQSGDADADKGSYCYGSG